MKARNLFCVVLFLGLLSCEKHEGNSSNSDQPLKSQEIGK